MTAFEICDVCGDKVWAKEWQPGQVYVSFKDHNNENYERHVGLSHTTADAERIIREHNSR